jgi:outer membrane protein OmpA-like peptidoglycan-associated protein
MKLRRRSSGESVEWLGVSDLMAGLMMVFLFIAVSYMRPILKTQEAIESTVTAWNETELDILEALKQEFEEQLPKWDAELQKDLTVRFRAPNVLFDTGKATLKPRFKEILAEFFPRYLHVLSEYRSSIVEVRIEGHTSSAWHHAAGEEEAYFNNMELSQARTRSTLEYSLGLPEVFEHREWARALITANGLSSSQPVKNEDGSENEEASRRVEFRIRTNTKDRILEILRSLEES